MSSKRSGSARDLESDRDMPNPMEQSMFSTAKGLLGGDGVSTEKSALLGGLRPLLGMGITKEAPVKS